MNQLYCYKSFALKNNILKPLHEALTNQSHFINENPPNIPFVIEVLGPSII